MFSVPLEGAICPTLPKEQKLWFFSEEGSRSSHHYKAKAICHKCPVRPECRKRILDIERDLPISDIYGVVGGLGAEERKLLRREAS